MSEDTARSILEALRQINDTLTKFVKDMETIFTTVYLKKETENEK